MSIAALDQGEGAIENSALFRDAAHRVEIDQVFLNAVAGQKPDTPSVRLWRNHRCLVVGKAVTRQHGFDRTQALFTRKNIPIVVRSTGGTVVPHGGGTLNVSVIRAVEGKRRSVSESYMFLCDGIIEALRALGLYATTGQVPDSYCDGDYNIVVQGKKIAGTAQRWKRHKTSKTHWCCLAHASIAVHRQSTELGLVRDFYRAMEWVQPFSQAQHTSLQECLNIPDDGRERLDRRLQAALQAAFIKRGCLIQ